MTKKKTRRSSAALRKLLTDLRWECALQEKDAHDNADPSGQAHWGKLRLRLHRALTKLEAE